MTLAAPLGRSPLLLLAAALVALAVFFAQDAGPAQAQPRVVPNAPQNVQLTAGDNRLTLTWQAPSSWGTFTANTGYELDVAVGAGINAASPPASGSALWASIWSGSDTSYTLWGTHEAGSANEFTVTNGNKYHLRIRALTKNPSDLSDTLPSEWVYASGTPESESSRASGCAGIGRVTVAAHTDSGNPVDNALKVTWSGSGRGLVEWRPKSRSWSDHSWRAADINFGNVWVRRQSSINAASGYVIDGLNPIAYEVNVSEYSPVGDSKVSVPHIECLFQSLVYPAATPTGETLEDLPFVANPEASVRFLPGGETPSLGDPLSNFVRVQPGGMGFYDVRLGGQPNHDVKITPYLKRADEGKMTFSNGSGGSSVTFRAPRYRADGSIDPGDWFELKRITVNVAMDADTHHVHILHRIDSYDRSYVASENIGYSATLTVSEDNNQLFLGCLSSGASGGQECDEGGLDDVEVKFAGERHQIVQLAVNQDHGYLGLSFGNEVPRSLAASATLRVGGEDFKLRDAEETIHSDGHDFNWSFDAGLGWSVGDTVSIRLLQIKADIGSAGDDDDERGIRYPLIQWVSITQPSGYDPSSDGDDGADLPDAEESLMDRCASYLPSNALSVSEVEDWRDEHPNNAPHVLRWNEVLAAFGADVPAGVTAMTVAESRDNERRWTPARWTRVTATLEALDTCRAAEQDPPNQTPTVASAIADATIVNESGTHSVSLSGVFSDADNDSLTITASSSSSAVATASVSSDYATLTVTAKSRGTATITVNADDGNGGTASDEFTIKVKAAPTVAAAIGDQTLALVGGYKAIALSSVFADADGDALTYAAASSDDTVVHATAGYGELTLYSVFDPGSATVTLTARDTDGNTVTDTFTVTVAAAQPPANNAPTVASAIADATIVNESGTHSVSLSGVFSDSDNDSLTITAGSSSNAVAAASVSSDYATLTVTAKSRGTATITVTANDGNGGTVSDAFTVTVKAAPVVASAIADVSGLTTGTTQEISLSGVFSDADNDTLTITAGSSSNAVATASSNGSTLTVSAKAQGTATITVTARDSDGNRVSDTFDVSVAPEEEEQEAEASDGAPTVVSPISDFGLEGPERREFDLNQVFRDPEGGELTFSLASSHYHISTGWIEGSTLTVVGISTGTAVITVTAEDPDGNTASVSFQVSVSPAS